MNQSQQYPDWRELAEQAAAAGDTPTKEEWDKEPEYYIGHCHKQCWDYALLKKGWVFEYGLYGIYVCTACGYAYPAYCNPKPVTLEEINAEAEPEE